MVSRKEKGHGARLLKSIRKVQGIFKAKTIFDIGNRRRVKIRHDVWSDDIPLGESFPFLFTFVASMEE